MKKKILLAFLLVSMLVCLFAISVSAEDMTHYIEFKVQLQGESDYISVYQPNTKNNPELHFTGDFFTKLDQSEKIEDKTKIVKIDMSDAYAHGVSNSYIGVLGAGNASDFINVTDIKFPNRTGFTTIGTKFCMGWTSLETVDFGCAKTIKNTAFKGCTSLKEITVPATITYIETNMCEGCTGLTKVTILGEAELLASAFYGCTSLTEVSIENVKYISSSTFAGCTSLTSITLPKNATKIDSHAFNGAGITSITIPASVKSIGEKAFLNSTVLTSVVFEPNSQLTYIGSSAFSGCTGITGEYDFSNVTEFASSAFYGCTGITSVNAPKVKTIGSNAFKNCTGLKNITTTSELTSISDSAFEGCTVLTGTFDLINVTQIRNNAFKNCSLVAFGDVELPNLTYIGSAFVNCAGLTSVVIPEGITGLGGFGGCTGLKSVTLPSTLKELYGVCFDGCTSLENVTFKYDYEKYPVYGSAFTKVGNGSVFKNCSSLKTLIFPNSLTHIDNSTFSGCTSLETLVLGASFSSVNQMPAIPSTVKNFVLPVAYRINATLFAWDTNKFTRPTSFVVYYTGTKAQAEELQAINTSCWEVSHSTLVSYEEFTSKDFVRDDTLHYMVYDYNVCKAFYQDKHNTNTELRYAFSGADYITPFCSYADCTRCPKAVETPIIDELFTSKGYSKFEDAFMYDIKVNHDAIEEYKVFCKENFEKDVVINYGLVVSGNKAYTSLINADGTVVNNDVLKINFDGTNYNNLQVKFNNINTDAYKALSVHACAYLIVNGEVSYVGDGTTANTATAICYNDIEDDEETGADEGSDESGDETEA